MDTRMNIKPVCLLGALLAATFMGCAKKEAGKPAPAATSTGQPAVARSMAYERARNMLEDKTLSKAENPSIARTLQDLYAAGGCVGVGYGDKQALADSVATTAYATNMCRAGEPGKTIRFRALNGTYYCIMATNVNAYDIPLEK